MREKIRSILKKHKELCKGEGGELIILKRILGRRLPKGKIAIACLRGKKVLYAKFINLSSSNDKGVNDESESSNSNSNSKSVSSGGDSSKSSGSSDRNKT